MVARLLRSNIQNWLNENRTQDLKWKYLILMVTGTKFLCFSREIVKKTKTVTISSFNTKWIKKESNPKFFSEKLDYRGRMDKILLYFPENWRSFRPEWRFNSKFSVITEEMRIESKFEPKPFSKNSQILTVLVSFAFCKFFCYIMLFFFPLYCCNFSIQFGLNIRENEKTISRITTFQKKE